MQPRWIGLGIALAAMITAGIAAARDPDPHGDCHNIQDESLALPLVGHVSVTLPAGLPVSGTYYLALGSTSVGLPTGGSVTLPAPQVWQETNDWPGLQTHAHTCTLHPSFQVITVPADTQVA